MNLLYVCAIPCNNGIAVCVELVQRKLISVKYYLFPDKKYTKNKLYSIYRFLSKNSIENIGKIDIFVDSKEMIQSYNHLKRKEKGFISYEKEWIQVLNLLSGCDYTIKDKGLLSQSVKDDLILHIRMKGNKI